MQEIEELKICIDIFIEEQQKLNTSLLRVLTSRFHRIKTQTLTKRTAETFYKERL